MNKNILLVEDEVLIAMMEKSELETCGYHIEHVTSGEEAVEYINTHFEKTDLILMDIDLGSGIDGTEAAEEILSCHDIPIVFLSSHTEREIVEKTEKITSYGYVVKNSPLTVLDASIKMAFKLFDEQNKSEKQKTLLENIIDNMPGFVLWKDKNLKFQGCNKNFAKECGFSSPQNIIGKTDRDLTFTKDEIEAYERDDRFVLEHGIPKIHIQEQSHVTNEKVINFDTTKIPLKNSNGETEGILVVAIDVTKEKEDTKRINYLSSITENVSDSIVVTDVDHKITYLNKAAERLYGYEANEIIGKTPEIFNAEPDPGKYQNNIYENIRAGESWTGRALNKKKDGTTFLCYFEVSSLIKNNKIIAYIGVQRDISKEVETAKQLIEAKDEAEINERKYRLIFENAPIGIVQYDEKGIVKEYNESYLKIFKSKREILDNLNILKLQDQKLINAVKKTLNNEIAYYDNEYHSIYSDHVISARAICFPLTEEDGSVIGGVSIVEDVTEQKKIHKEIDTVNQKNSLLSAVVENSDNIVVVKDLDLRVLATNQAFANAAGHTSIETMIGKTDAEIFGVSPESEPVKSYMRDERKAQMLKKGEYILREEPVVTATGETRIVLTKKYPIFDDKDKLIATGNISVDITERKNAEKIITEQRNNYQNLIMMLTEGFWMADKNGYLIVANNAAAKMSGYDSPDEMIGMHMKNFYNNPDERENMISALSKKGQLNNYTIVMRKKDGSTIVTSSNIRVNYNESGAMENTEALIRDISEIETLHDKLEKQNAIMKSILKVIPGSLNVVDMDFNLILSNKEQYLLNEEDRKNNQGHKCYSAFQHLQEPCPWCHIKDVYKTGKEYAVITDETDPRTKATGRIWRVINKPLFDNDNNMIGAIEYGSNVTDIKNAEKKAVQQYKEIELLVKESHHRIKNHIANIVNLIQIQISQESNEKVIQSLKDTLTRVDSIHILYNKLLADSNYSELSTKHYLEDLITAIQKTFPEKKIQVFSKIDDFKLNPNTINTLGILINEFITNSMKHAFHENDQGIVNIELTKKQDNVKLVIKDNGPGLPENYGIGESTSLGLMLIQMMAQQIHGELNFVNEDGFQLNLEFGI